MALVNNKLPAATVGSLRDRERAHAMIDALDDLIQDKDDGERIASQLKQSIENVIPLKPSKKHMSHRQMPNLKSSPSLSYRKAA